MCFMMKKNKKIIVTILLIVEIMLVNLTYQSFLHRKVNTEKETYRNKQFAMYVNDGNGYKEYTGDSLFPKGYYLNPNLSYCNDDKGERVEDVLTSDGESVTVTSNKTIYCTLYFEKLNSTILTYNPEKSGTSCVTVQCTLDELYTLLK